jgi:hypothetical protein
MKTVLCPITHYLLPLPQSLIPNPQSPIPNPQSPIPVTHYLFVSIYREKNKGARSRKTTYQEVNETINLLKAIPQE